MSTAIQFDRSKMLPFTFQEAEHRYSKPDGQRVLSSTQILTALGYSNMEAAEAANPTAVARKRVVGKLTHQAVHFHDENDLPALESWPEVFDRGVTRDEVWRRLIVYKQFLADTGYTPIINEGRHLFSVFGMTYAGQFDSVGQFRKRLAIVDVKNASGQPQRSWGLQLTSYALGVSYLSGIPATNFLRIALQLTEERYKIFSSDDPNSRIFRPNDFQLWPACLAIALDRQTHGLLKEIP